MKKTIQLATILLILISGTNLNAQNFTPALFNPALWLDAADTSSVIHNSGVVTSWNDISGNGNNATQNTTDNQPFYISTVEGIEFDGSDVLIGNNLGYGPDTTITLFVAAIPNSGSSKGSVIAKGQWTSTSDYRIELGEHGYDVAIQDAREWNSSGSNWDIAHKNMYYTYFSHEKEVGYYFNGERVELPRTNVAYNPNNDPFSIGGRFNYSDYFEGKIYEVILYQKMLTQCQAEQIEGYLAHKWGIQPYVISNHPFKNYPFGICSEIEVNVDENAPNNTTIDTIHGAYVDTLVSFSVWRIEDGGLYENTFALDPTGILTVNDNTHLDYETASAFNIVVSALADGVRVYGGVRININDLPDGGTQKTHSELWGVDGEKWNPRGRLPDFSYVGYKSGEADYHYVNNIVDVTTFGADNTDSLSDVTAILNAIASIDSGIVYFPAGLYVIDSFIDINKSNMVLRGEGNDSITGTRFYFPYNATDLGLTGSGISSGGKGYIINFSGVNAGPNCDIIENAKMGDRSVTVSNPSLFQVGDYVNIEYGGTQPVNGELWDHILNNQNADWQCSVGWSNGNGGLMMYHIIERIEGNIITLKEPIRLDLNLSWSPKLHLRTDWNLQNCGIENIFIKHKYIPQPPHLTEPGYNSVMFKYCVNCWIDNVSIEHADNGILFNSCGYGEMKNISFYGRGGHHGWKFAYSSHCLADTVYFGNYDPWIHSFTLTHKTNGNVVSNVTGVSGVAISTDFHRNTPWETLITNLQNDWNYNSSGVWCAGPNAGKRTVYWNMGGAGFTSFPRWDEYQTTLVGDLHIKEEFHPEKGWHEKVPNLAPTNLYYAQLDRRLNLPADPLFQTDNFIGNRLNWWERDPSRWRVKNTGGNEEYQLFFSETPELTGNRLGEYTVLDSIFSSDMIISADIKSLEKININPMADAALIINYQDDNNYYFGSINATSGQSGIYKVENGSASLLKQLDIALTNDTLSYAFENKNGMLIFYENGAKIDSIMDTSFTGGKVGLGTLDDAASFDNISISNYCKDYIKIKNKIFNFNRIYNAANTIEIDNISIHSSFQIILNAPQIINKNNIQVEGELKINPSGCTSN